MKFREQRGGLDESMRTLVELSDRNSLVEHCQQLLSSYGFKLEPSDLGVTPYIDVADTRIGWSRTYLVQIDGYGVIGYTDEAC